MDAGLETDKCVRVRRLNVVTAYEKQQSETTQVVER